MTVDEAMQIASKHGDAIKHHMAISEAAEVTVILANEVSRLRDEVNGLEAQEPVAFWWVGPDGKDNGGPYKGKPSDVAIDNARNMGCDPILLYASPVPAPAVAVPEGWRNAVREFLESHDAAWAELISRLPTGITSVSVSTHQADSVKRANVLRALLQSATQPAVGA